MRLIIISVAVFMLLFSSVHAFAGETAVKLDSELLQTYKGKTGRWHTINGRAEFESYVSRYGSPYQDVVKINGRVTSFKGNIFFPFSDDYIKSIDVEASVLNPPAADTGLYLWPLGRKSDISSHFGMRWGELHTGIDLPAVKGTPILAALDGRVVYVGYNGGHGNSILLEHRNNFFSRYSHNSVTFVKKGDIVRKGQIIGLVGSTGNSTGNHLHFEIRYRDIPLNPMDFLAAETGN